MMGSEGAARAARRILSSSPAIQRTGWASLTSRSTSKSSSTDESCKTLSARMLRARRRTHASRATPTSSSMQPPFSPTGSASSMLPPATMLVSAGGQPCAGLSTSGKIRRTIFPLGEYHKEEVRRIAEDRNLAVAYTPESQDICFIPDGNYRGFIRKKVAAKPGEIVDKEGRTLGRHKGVIDFTVGQRRGIGVSAPTPLYVTEVRPHSRQVVVGGRKELEVREIRVGSPNWFLSPEEAEAVQVRYNSPPVPCEIEYADGGDTSVRLLKPVIGIAPGQSAVFYKGDRVVGGGVVRQSA